MVEEEEEERERKGEGENEEEKEDEKHEKENKSKWVKKDTSRKWSKRKIQKRTEVKNGRPLTSSSFSILSLRDLHNRRHTLISIPSGMLRSASKSARAASRAERCCCTCGRNPRRKSKVEQFSHKSLQSIDMPIFSSGYITT